MIARDDLWRTRTGGHCKTGGRPPHEGILEPLPACIAGTCSGQTPPEDTYAVKIRAKKRCIDPLVRTGSGAKRLTDLDADFAAQLQAFLRDEFDRYVWARFDLQS